MSGAFPDPAVRAQLLDELAVSAADPDAPAPAIAQGNRITDLNAVSALAERAGLSPAFILMVTALDRFEPGFAETMVRTVPTGADTLAIVRRWHLALWERLAPLVDDAGLRAACDELAERLRSAAAGVPVTPREWREARRPMMLADTTISGLTARVLGAGAWDLEAMPSAASDIVLALWELLRVRNDVAAGWTADHTAAQRRQDDEATAAGLAVSGPRPDGVGREWHESEEGRAWHEAFDEGERRFRDENPISLPERYANHDAIWAEIIGHARSAMSDVLAASPVAA